MSYGNTPLVHAVVAFILSVISGVLHQLNIWADSYMPILYAVGILVSVFNSLNSMIKSRKTKK